MGNTSMNISLPESLKKYVNKRLKDSGYSNHSDYVRALIREDMKRKAQEELEKMLLEGLDSGEHIEVNDKWLDKKKKELMARAQKLKQRV